MTVGLLMNLSSGALIMPPATSPFVIESVVETAPKEIKAEDYQPITDSKNIERFVNDYFADIPILAKIAKCESRFRHLDSEGDVLKGNRNQHDTGVMQINVLYHAKTAEKLGLDIHGLDDNVAYARYLYQKQGVKPWASSSACWAKYNNQSQQIAKK